MTKNDDSLARPSKPEDDKPTATRSKREREAYPDELLCRERELLGLRREGKKGKLCVGLALSGGGLRSATFSFGVVQALAKMGALCKIDALSTVSGGGYTGSMLSRLFDRESVTCVEDVECAISPSWPEEARSGGEEAPKRIATGTVFRWLRDNGHHLAPNGGGDILAAVAVVLRNWASVHVVLATFVLAGFTLMQLLVQWWRGLNAEWAGEAAARWDWVNWLAPGWSHEYAWSPWFTVALAPLAVSGALGLFYSVDQCWSRYTTATMLDRASTGRNWSVGLKFTLLASALLVGVALVDTLGMATYTLWYKVNLASPTSVIAALPALAALAVGARRLATGIFGKGGAERPKIPIRVAAGLAVSVLLVAWLTAVNAISHGIAWEWNPPSPMRCAWPPACPDYVMVPTGSWECLLWWFIGLTAASAVGGRCCRFLNVSSLQTLYAARITRAFLGASNPCRNGERKYNAVTQVIKGDDALLPWDADPCEKRPCFRQFRKGAPLHYVNVTVNENVDNKTRLQRAERGGIGMAVGPAGISAGIRHHVVARTPIGSSESCSSERTKECPRDVRVSVYPKKQDCQFRMFEYAANECGMYQGERLSLGEWTGISGAAFSTGTGSRTSFSLSFLLGMFNIRLGYWWDSERPQRGDRDGKASGSGPSRTWQSLLRYLKGKGYRRKNEPGASNDETASVSPSTEAHRGGNWLGRVFTSAFPVQSHLFDELFARFHGSARRLWNLSDGGHFENLAAYELIRRRVPVIVIVDAEADPDYAFEGLGNLVRKARADFDAEIEFLGEKEICEWRRCTRDPDLRYFGTLEMLRRGSWQSPTVPCPEDDKQTAETVLEEPDRTRTSLAHAALARVRYEDSKEDQSIIIYVKPTIVGDEPVDIRHYHEEHPDFPQQTTGDQFFDEPQWESYRALGERIGGRVLKMLKEQEPGLSLFRSLAPKDGNADK